jgi:hypothetical protein
MGRQGKKWSDFSPPQQLLVILSGILQLSLFAAAVFDLLKRPADQINRSKPFWLAVSLVNFIGPISYFLFGRRATSLENL